MLFCIVNTKELPTLGTHMATTMKFASGIGHHDYEIVTITDNSQLAEIPDLSTTIFLISNHGIDFSSSSFGESLKCFSRYKNAFKLCWHFHTWLLAGNELPFNKWALTGEHYHSLPATVDYHKSWNLQKSLEHKYIPLTFSSFLHPENIGEISLPKIYDTQFVGTSYKTSWLQQLPTTHKCYIRNIALQTSENDRISSFLQSYTALGFHAELNIANNVVTERVPEALSLGAVCLTDNPSAVEFTDGIAELVSSFEDLKDKIDFYKSNSTKAKEKIELGYSWAKSKETYFHVAETCLKQLNKL